MQPTKPQLLISIIFLFTSVSLTACKPTINESDNTNLNSNQEIKSMGSNPCDNLHKVTSRDDLIRQMYETAFKDDCLYEMSKDDLENIWGISVKNYLVVETPDADIRTIYHDVESPFGFIVVKQGRNIAIQLTQKAFDENKSLLSKQTPPAYWGNASMNYILNVTTPDTVMNKYYESGEVLQYGYAYHWKNKKLNLNLTLSSGDTVRDINFYKDI